MSNPHIYIATRVNCFVARWGIEPQTIRLKGKRFNHYATDLAVFLLRTNQKDLGLMEVTHNVAVLLKSDRIEIIYLVRVAELVG